MNAIKIGNVSNRRGRAVGLDRDGVRSERHRLSQYVQFAQQGGRRIGFAGTHQRRRERRFGHRGPRIFERNHHWFQYRTEQG
uniref:Uncharacterized protein n=1 Tax=Rhodopseudomonas palustris (strain BisA53) TaxID=316055 RepID=Q07IZ7_RHOP5